MAMRCVDVLAVALVVLCGVCSAMKVDLATLLKGRHRNEFEAPAQKRSDDGNPCPEPEKPFPCKYVSQCIPMGYVCDNNIDCDDGYDEDPDVCTAAHRPPVVDIMRFLEAEKSWIIPRIFGGKSSSKIAHSLAVSQTVNDFRRRVGLSKGDLKNICLALKGVKAGNEEVLEGLGMPRDAWEEVVFFFSRLIKSGFTC